MRIYNYPAPPTTRSRNRIEPRGLINRATAEVVNSTHLARPLPDPEATAQDTRQQEGGVNVLKDRPAIGNLLLSKAPDLKVQLRVSRRANRCPAWPGYGQAAGPTVPQQTGLAQSPETP